MNDEFELSAEPPAMSGKENEVREMAKYLLALTGWHAVTGSDRIQLAVIAHDKGPMSEEDEGFTVRLFDAKEREMNLA
jgi:hypothetical protein